MSKDDYRIWSNADLDYEEWKDWMEEEYPTLSDDERVAMMYEENGHYLEDERLNLDIQLSQPILVVADLGLWNGRRTGYKEIPSGNIRDCLYSDYDYTTWYVDRNGDFRCDDTHHDGTNHYLYRVYKDNVSQAQKPYLKFAIASTDGKILLGMEFVYEANKTSWRSHKVSEVITKESAEEIAEELRSMLARFPQR